MSDTLGRDVHSTPMSYFNVTLEHIHVLEYVFELIYLLLLRPFFSF